MARVSIYALIDQRDGTVRYVGQSEQPYSRLRQHLSTKESSNPFLNSWIWNLRGRGKYDQLPEHLDIEMLERTRASPREGETLRQAKERIERKWIDKMVDRGEPLLNDLPRSLYLLGKPLFTGGTFRWGLSKNLEDEARARGTTIRQVLREIVLQHFIEGVTPGPAWPPSSYTGHGWPRAPYTLPEQEKPLHSLW